MHLRHRPVFGLDMFASACYMAASARLPVVPDFAGFPESVKHIKTVGKLRGNTCLQVRRKVNVPVQGFMSVCISGGQ